MTPEEIARRTVEECPHIINEPGACESCIWAALAASEQRGKDADKDAWREYRAWWTGRAADELKRLGIYLTMCHPEARQENHTVTDTALAVIASLQAQLQASEREVESWRIMADNMRVRAEASERALERVREILLTEDAENAQWDALAILNASASPGSPQEKGK